MGQFTELLQQNPDEGARQDPTMPETRFSSLITGAENQEAARLKAGMNLASDKNPDDEARILKLQLRTGLAPDLIRRNLDQVEQEANRKDFDAKKFKNESPIVAKWLTEHPDHMALAKDDLSNLSGIEWLFKAPRRAYQEGNEQVELAQYGYQQMLGNELTPEQQARADAIELKNGRINYGAEGWWENALIESGKQLPNLAGSLEGRLKGGLIGGLTFAGGAALYGQTGPQVLTPEEVVTVPAAALTGMGVGFTTGSAEFSFRLESGLAYREFLAIEDENGKKLDPGVARVAAMMVGGVNAGLETFSIGTFLKAIPGGKNLTGEVSRRTIKQALKNPTFVGALTRAAAQYGRVVSVEVATELLQEMSTILGGELSKQLSDGDFKGMTSEQIGQRLEDTVVKTAQAVSLMGAPGPVANVFLDGARASRAKKQQEMIKALGEGSAASKLRERMPDKYQEFVSRIRENGPVENVYIPVEQWNEYFQTQGIDPSEMAAEVTGSQQAYNEAAATGDMVIPLDRYAARVAGTDTHTGLAKDIRFQPDDMTLRQAEEFEANAPEIIQRYIDEAGGDQATAAGDQQAAVYQDVLGQLLGSGVERSAAEKQASLTASVFNTLGQRTGIAPEALYKQYGLKISRSIPEVLKPFAKADTTMDPLIDRLRAGDVPSQREIFGQSLLQFLREQGGLRDDGGELSARDAQLARGKPGEKRLVSPEGRSLDDAAEIAAEAGYITDRNPDLLLEAIDQELSGNEVFRPGSEDAQLLAVREALVRLEEELGQAGIDIQNTENDVIKAFLRGEARQVKETTEETQSFDQTDPQSVAENATLKEYKDAVPEESEIERLRKRNAELEQIIRTNEKTGLPNRMAFDEDADFGPTVSAFDLDGFKKLNTSLKHEIVDKQILRPLGGLLMKAMEGRDDVKIYHFQGDEFAVRFKGDQAAGDAFMRDLQDRMDSVGIDITVKDHRKGTIKTYTLDGVGLSYGVASGLGEDTYDAADQASEEQKLQRLESGQREDPRAPGPSRRLRETSENPERRGSDRAGVQPARGAQELNQQQGKTRRGRIRFTTSSRLFEIELLENANLSTFLHESGHFYLEVLGDLAARPDAPQQIKDDYQAILNWFKVDSREGIKTEHHEKFARGFEAYLMEGKAPTIELQGLFSRFQAWLTQIYRAIKALDVTLTDDVRGVFDRLVATDEEIRASNEAVNFTPVSFLASDFANDQEFQAYQKAVADERQQAQEELTAEAMREITREQRDWWKEERAKVRKGVEERINAMPVYLAMHFLQKGELPDGSPLPEGWVPVKLSKKALIDAYGSEFVKRLPRPFVYAREGGVSADQVAAMFGFDSGDAMIQALVNAKPRVKAIEAETNAIMEQQYGNMLLDGTLPERAMLAVHNTKRSELLLREFKILSKKAGKHDRLTSLQIIKAASERIISQKKVRDINPHLYRLAEGRFAKLAFEAAAANNLESAIDFKRKQLLNHELYRQARAARDEVDATLDYTKKLMSKPAQQRIGKAGADYLEQINGLLERFDFTRISTRALEKRKALADWIKEQEGAGYTVQIPDELRSETFRRSYKELSFQELQGIRDTLKNIEHLSQLKNKLMANAKHRQLQEAADDIVAAIMAEHTIEPEPKDISKRMRDKIKLGWSKFDAAHTKMEFLFRFLDGHETGVVWQNLFKPLAEAENAENALIKEASKRMNKIFAAYDRKERVLMHINRVHIPEIKQSLTRASMLAVALNWGNQYNRDVLMRGYGWSESQVQAILDKLDKRDWEVVQGIWDFLDGYWKDIAALQKEMTGLIPERVEASVVRTKFGEFKGGYYPLKYNAEWSFEQHKLDEKADVNSLFGSNWTAPVTKQGHTKERTDSGNKPVLLDFSVLTGHITNVVHDLTHRKVIMDIDRLIHHKSVAAAIEGSAGRVLYRELRPWLQSIANDARQPAGPLEGVLHHVRLGATIVNMGWKITTAIVQPLGYLQSVDVLGEKHAWIGLQKFINTPMKMKKTVEWVLEQSSMMRDRQRTFDRDVRDMLKTFTVTGQMAPVQKSFFYLTGLLDMSVAVPTWLGAYQKAMDGEAEGVAAGDKAAAVDFADSIVRTTQSAGAVKDLARIQRGSEYHRIFTLFYSYFSVLYNLFKRRFQMTSGMSDLPRAAASMFYLWFVPAILSELIVGRGPDDDDEWASWAAKKLITYPTQAIIGIRDIVNGMGPYGYEASPVFAAFEGLVKTLKAGGKAVDPDEELERADIKQMFITAGYWLHLPTRQTWITGSYLYDWMTGEDEPDTVGEAVRNLAFSRE